MITLNVTFEDKEHFRLTRVKMNYNPNISWHDYLLERLGVDTDD